MWRITDINQTSFREVIKLRYFAQNLIENMNEEPNIMRDMIRERRTDLIRRTNKKHLRRTISIEVHDGEVLVKYKNNDRMRTAFKLSN